VIQTGDPTGTGEGGTNIYEDGDKSIERYGEDWGRLLRLPEERWGDKITLGDEAHSRLKFNRRGLVGMARMSEQRGEGVQGQYGSQFFITLDDCRAELDGKCTMFGRVEGEGIYSVLKVAGGEIVEGTERPVFPEKITRVEVLEMPEGAIWRTLRKRERVAQRTVDDESRGKKEKPKKKKGGKALLSFGGDAGDEEDGAISVVRPKKAKFNTALIDGPVEDKQPITQKQDEEVKSTAKLTKKRKSPEPARPSHRSPSPEPKRRKPSFHESTTQLPLRDPESPSRSPTPDVLPVQHVSIHKSASALEAEITALKATMKRDTTGPTESKKKLSALESLIPATSTRGRKRPRPGESHTTDASADTNNALKTLNAFRARLKQAETQGKPPAPSASANGNHHNINNTTTITTTESAAEDEEAMLCDLHFIAHCQSCSNWAAGDENDNKKHQNADDDDRDLGFLGHALSFEKDRLGKDLTWKRKNEEELVVIDPRERERELGINGKGGGKEKRRGAGTGREWDRRGA